MIFKTQAMREVLASPISGSIQQTIHTQDCLCCEHKLLRHIRNNRVYWFCRRCWRDMPCLR